MVIRELDLQKLLNWCPTMALLIVILGLSNVFLHTGVLGLAGVDSELLKLSLM